MKFRKSIIVTSLASIMAVSMVGAITGTVAWYQYSTRATASVIATSAGQSGNLQIKLHSEDASLYTRDIYTAKLKGSNTNAKLYPVTYGGVLTSAGTQTKDANVGTFKKNPEIGVADMASWLAATSAKEFIQYTVDLRATDASGAGVSGINVYASDIVLEDTASVVTSALRMHIACGTKYMLIAPTAISGTTLPTFGKLDLDNDGQADVKGGYEWAADKNDVVVYGTADTYQTAYGISDVKATRSNSDGTLSGGLAIGTTDASGVITVTVTIWLEGWAQLDPYADPKDTDVKAMWDNDTLGKTIHAGITFDVGSNAFNA